MQIEAIYEPKFSKWSFGFRPGKSCHDAVKRFQQRFNGIDYYIKIDLEDFFRNVNHDILNKILSRDITKHKVVKIIDTMVKSGIMRNHIKTPTYSGVPQGGIISPILSNIVLNEFDKFMEKKILPVIQKEANINSEYSNIVSKISRLKKKRRDNQNKEKLNKLIEKFKTLKRYSRRPLSVE
ncbi:Group II intron-encoded protein ltrA [Candidatus Phytoplasma pini]|uniref:RNA-directed DNA polymerase n=1 Tax=Candidatus Phytoplasma pini TaxID=267362 RepID=A0A559KJ84_9MOLU|nr:Group II intron-encoded protein ltrA [Candidatus Phytoplasma pini]